MRPTYQIGTVNSWELEVANSNLPVCTRAASLFWSAFTPLSLIYRIHAPFIVFLFPTLCLGVFVTTQIWADCVETTTTTNISLTCQQIHLHSHECPGSFLWKFVRASKWTADSETCLEGCTESRGRQGRGRTSTCGGRPGLPFSTRRCCRPRFFRPDTSCTASPGCTQPHLKNKGGSFVVNKQQGKECHTISNNSWAQAVCHKGAKSSKHILVLATATWLLLKEAFSRKIYFSPYFALISVSTLQISNHLTPRLERKR